MTLFNFNKIKDIRRTFTGFLTETSPFEQLSQHAEEVQATVHALVEELHGYTQGQEIKGEEVSNLEFEADQKKQEIRRELPRSDLLMPVARSDLLSLLWHQDEIADNSQDVAELLPLLKLKSQLPSEYQDSLDRLAEILKKSIREYRDIVVNAGAIIKGTTSGEEKVNEVWSSIEKINKLEHNADKTTRKAVKSVYEAEGMEGIEKYHLIQIALKANNILDHIENAANFIRIMTNR
ncbi:MAG: DUF47 domain-containing protein [Candidatus Bipolaricaulia bacterium]